MTIDDVIEGARLQGIDDLGKVKLGVLEPDGRFSFIQFQPEQHEEPEHKGA
ncbi:MAG: YetF domain-containing protein [Actinomycetota bacterium]